MWGFAVVSKEYEKQLLETIERQEKSLEDARRRLDAILTIHDRIQNGCTKMQLSQDAANDLQGMYNIDILEAIADIIRENAKNIAEEEIQKLRATYGK